MAEPWLSNLTDMVVGKSKFLSYSQVCKKLGHQNEIEWVEIAKSQIEPLLLKVEEEQAYTPKFRSWCLDLKTSLYEAEDMLDNQHDLRHLVIKTTQSQVGESESNIGNLMRRLDDPASKRVDLKSGTLRSFLFTVMCCIVGFLLFLWCCLC